MRFFSRDQQIIALLIGLLIVMIYVMRPLSKPLSFLYDSSGIEKNDQAHQVVIKVQGMVNKPGVYSFDENPSCVEAIQEGGGIVEGLALETFDRTPALESGDRLTVTKKNEYEVGIDISDMDAASQLVLGIPLDINNADAEKLDVIPGVGRHLAERIVRFREKQGRVRNLDDLLGVQGIGKKKLVQLKPYMTIK